MTKYFFRTILRILPLIIIVGLTVAIVTANQYVTSGSQIQSLDAAISDLKSHNEELEEQIASASSLVTVATRAHAMGFTEPTKTQIVVISSQNLSAALPRL